MFYLFYHAVNKDTFDFRTRKQIESNRAHNQRLGKDISFQINVVENIAYLI